MLRTVNAYRRQQSKLQREGCLSFQVNLGLWFDLTPLFQGKFFLTTSHLLSFLTIVIGLRIRFICLAAGLLLLTVLPVQAETSPLEMAIFFETMVDKRLTLPDAEHHHYAQLIVDALAQAHATIQRDQYLVMVDRSPLVHTVFLYWAPVDGMPLLIGASPTSTGRPGRFDYFETPLGVFEHTVDNLDFRAEGTKNENGIRGYGAKGMRVYDFGWQLANKGWGDRSPAVMRLQMHATDPDFLEGRLGSAQSKGCIRIPASLNLLIDLYGLLDRDYEQSLLDGKNMWMLHPNRQATPWSGRYLIIVDSMRTERPTWANIALP